MCAKTRLYFSLWVVLLGSVLANPSTAEGREQRLLRTPLPTDSALSVSVGVKATWQSLSSSTRHDQTREIRAEVSGYALGEMPTLANLSEHQFTSLTPPEDPDWYVFQPATEKVSLTVDIVDTAKRLGKIVCFDLRTGQQVGSLNASTGGYALRGQFKIFWERPFYRIEGYDKRNLPLFRLGVSHGQPDTYIHFTVIGGFVPYRPAAVSSPRFAVSDTGRGAVGDPYDVRHAILCALPEDGFSLGSCARDQKNDVSVENPLQAPDPYRSYRKKVCLESLLGGALVYHFNVQADQPGFIEEAQRAEKDDNAAGVPDLIQPPYSDCTGRWSVRFVGKATAFLLVPNTIARQKGRLADLKALFGTLSKKLPDDKIHSLAVGLEEAFAIWLHSEAGKQSGYTAGMVKALGDVKTVEVQADRRDFVVAKGLFERVTFALAPNVPPLHGKGSIAIKKVGFSTPVPPPDPVYPSTLTLTSPTYTGTLLLPKGFQWDVRGSLDSPGLYQPVFETTFFDSPALNTVQVPMLLSTLQELKIYTLNADKPAEGIILPVQVLNAANQVVASGDSERQKDGKIAFSASFLSPGTYTIKVGQGAGKAKWEGLTILPVFRGRLQETNLAVTPLRKLGG